MDDCDCFVKENKKDECQKDKKPNNNKDCEKTDECKCEKIFEDVLEDLLITEIKQEEKKDCKKYYK